eukprot:snap_masked-scaffold_9-processed-gene-11.43-mRNA-1 protein AED:1.00 eAED:1.00 QI:0/-1/0/0/-1/1/1/0/982
MTFENILQIPRLEIDRSEDQRIKDIVQLQIESPLFSLGAYSHQPSKFSVLSFEQEFKEKCKASTLIKHPRTKNSFMNSTKNDVFYLLMKKENNFYSSGCLPGFTSCDKVQPEENFLKKYVYTKKKHVHRKREKNAKVSKNYVSSSKFNEFKQFLHSPLPLLNREVDADKVTVKTQSKLLFTLSEMKQLQYILLGQTSISCIADLPAGYENLLETMAGKYSFCCGVLEKIKVICSNYDVRRAFYSLLFKCMKSYVNIYESEVYALKKEDRLSKVWLLARLRKISRLLFEIYELTFAVNLQMKKDTNLFLMLSLICKFGGSQLSSQLMLKCFDRLYQSALELFRYPKIGEEIKLFLVSPLNLDHKRLARTLKSYLKPFELSQHLNLQPAQKTFLKQIPKKMLYSELYKALLSLKEFGFEKQDAQKSYTQLKYISPKGEGFANQLSKLQQEEKVFKKNLADKEKATEYSISCMERNHRGQVRRQLEEEFAVKKYKNQAALIAKGKDILLHEYKAKLSTLNATERELEEVEAMIARFPDTSACPNVSTRDSSQALMYMEEVHRKELDEVQTYLKYLVFQIEMKDVIMKNTVLSYDEVVTTYKGEGKKQLKLFAERSPKLGHGSSRRIYQRLKNMSVPKLQGTRSSFSMRNAKDDSLQFRKTSFEEDFIEPIIMATILLNKKLLHFMQATKIINRSLDSCLETYYLQNSLAPGTLGNVIIALLLKPVPSFQALRRINQELQELSRYSHYVLKEVDGFFGGTLQYFQKLVPEFQNTDIIPFSFLGAAWVKECFLSLEKGHEIILRTRVLVQLSQTTQLLFIKEAKKLKVYQPSRFYNDLQMFLLESRSFVYSYRQYVEVFVARRSMKKMQEEVQKEHKSLPSLLLKLKSFAEKIVSDCYLGGKGSQREFFEKLFGVIYRLLLALNKYLRSHQDFHVDSFLERHLKSFFFLRSLFLNSIVNPKTSDKKGVQVFYSFLDYNGYFSSLRKR